MAKFSINLSKLFYWFFAIVIMFIVCFALMFFTETQVPSMLTSSGIVAIISAIIGVLLSVLVTHILLQNQSDTEAQKDKDMEIYKQKIGVFSKITADLWKMIDDVNDAQNPKIASEKAEGFFKNFKTMCFNQLIFYLDQGEIKELTESIKKIDINNLSAKNEIDNIGKITSILQNSLKNEGKDTATQLRALYNLFDDKLSAVNKEEVKLQEQSIAINNEPGNVISNIAYWHFNMWDDAQIEAFKSNNWILSLFECEEDWRSNLLKKVNEGDVIFLFRRGGYGYIGAFEAKGREIFTKEDWSKLNDEARKGKDIYNAFNVNEATIVSSIIVKPIAYNYEGVGYLTVRRRTIERIYDEGAINYLLKGFSGIFDNEELKNYFGDRSQGKGKLDDGTVLELGDSLSKVIIDFNKQCSSEEYKILEPKPL
jgi:flagellin-specific chaperone FliS